MSYNSPVIQEAPRADVGLDGVLLNLQSRFLQIGWLEDNVYLRAYKNKFPNAEGDTITHPQVYLGNGEYQNVMFNDNLPCAIFFLAPDIERVLYTKPADSEVITYERELSLVFWCDLSRVSASYSADYPFTELIKREFMQTLAKSPDVIQISEYIEDPIERVFEGFDLPENKQVGKYPWAGVRINFKVQYKQSVRRC